MSRRWYTTYSGYDWVPEKGYSDLFKSYVQAIREWFHLQKTNQTGVEIAKGVWKPYDVQGQNVSVIVDRFEWKHYSEADEGVFFKLKMRVGTCRRTNFFDRLFNRTSPMKIIFNEEIFVLFDGNFPHSPPLFKVNNSGYRRVDDQHGHHLFRGGIMCIMADSSDWNPDKDTVLRAINACIDWIVWHNTKWGSNPGRWSHV